MLSIVQSFTAKKCERNISISKASKSFENFFLSRGLTQTTLALLWKSLCLKLLFIAVVSGVLKGSATILIKTGGTLSTLELQRYPQGKIFCYH